MKPVRSSFDDSLSVTRQQKLDTICRRFEAAWKQGQAPTIEAYLSEAEAEERRSLLRELLFLEIHYRGAPVSATAYEARFPDDVSVVRAVLSQQSADTRPPDTVSIHEDAPADGAMATLSFPSAGAEELPERLPVVPGYAIQRVLGRGGMGVVYEAVQVKLQRVVALKMIRSHQDASPEEIRRFHAEAEAIAKLNHPGIVPIHEIGDYQGLPYFVMGYVEGGNLAQRLKNGPLLPREAAGLVEKICRAVHCAHVQGIIHRDLKPANILLDADGQPKVTDFGLAKRVEGDGHLTISGQVLGTPSYMPPEQATGKIDQVGPAADIYALGAVLYCLLTGRPPFQAATVLETLLQVQVQEPVPPRQLNVAVDRDLETICLKCLQKEATRRYASAESMADDLQRFLKGETIRARAVSRPEQAWRWARRNRALAGLSATLLFVMVFGLVVMTFLYFQAKEGREQADTALGREQIANSTAETRRVQAEDASKKYQEAAQKEKEARAAEEERRKQADEARDAAQKATEESNLMLYVTSAQLAHRAWREGKSDQILELLHGPKMREQGEVRRGFEWGYLNRFHNAEVLAVAQSADYIAVSPDGRWVAAADANKVHLRESSTGRLAHLLELPKGSYGGRVWGLAFSPNGLWLATADTERFIRLWEVETGKELPLLRPEMPDKGVTIVGGKDKIKNDIVHGIMFSPDSQHLALSEGRYVEIFNIKTGKEVAALMGRGGRIRDVAFRPDGQRIAAIESKALDNSGGLSVWDLGSKKRVLMLPYNGLQPILRIVYSPDGKLLAWCEGSRAVVHDADTGTQVAILDTHTATVMQVAFSANGRYLATASMDKTVRIWDTATWKGDILLLGHNAGVEGAVFTSDGRRLISIARDGTMKFWQLPDATERSTFPAATAISVISPDGMRYALIDTGKKRISIRSIFTSTEIAECTGHVGPVASAAFSPDGKRLASCSLGQAYVWDAQTGQRLHELKDFKDPVQRVEFVDAGRRLLTLDARSMVQFWDVQTGKLTGSGRAPEKSAPLFSPDGSRFALLQGRRILIMDTATGKQISDIPRSVPMEKEKDKDKEKSHAFAMAFSHDGRRLAFIAATLQIADTDSGKILLALGGEELDVTGLAFSPDDRRLVSTRRNARKAGDVQIWETRTGQELLTVKTLQGSPSGLTFTDQRICFAVTGKSGTSIVVLHAGKIPAEEVVGRDAHELVHELFDKQVLRVKVIAALEADNALDTQKKKAALAITAALPEDSAEALNKKSRQIAIVAGGSASDYRRAKIMAEEACRLVPKNGVYMNTLGMSQYRCGELKAALATFDASVGLVRGRPNEFVADVAFVCMIWHQIGQTPKARSRIASLRKEVMSIPVLVNNTEIAALLAEAERVVKGPNENVIDPATAKVPAPIGDIVLQMAGKLAAGDPLDKKLTKSFHQVHTFKMVAGVTYTIDLVSSDFDAYLRLEDSSGKQLDADDDGGGDLNARIVHRAMKDDIMRIIATSFQAGATGAYSLTVRKLNPAGKGK